MHFFHPIWLWLENVTGVNIPSSGSKWYNFWSGFGSDLGELAILGSLVALYRHHNCHIKGCWRIGRHPVKGTPYLTCHKHTTQNIHQTIKQKHAREYPEQHKLLNAG